MRIDEQTSSKPVINSYKLRKRRFGVSSGSKDNLVSNASNVEMMYYAKLSGAKDIRDFIRRARAEVQRLDFSDLAFVLLTKAEIDTKELYTAPKSLAKSYFDGGYYEHDLVVPYLQENQDPIFQSQLHTYSDSAPFVSDQTRTMKELFKLNGHHKFFDYYHIPMKSSNGCDNAMLSVSVKGLNPFDFSKRISGKEVTLRLLAETIDYVGTRNFPEYFGAFKKDTEPQHGKLNRQPLRVLETMANGDFSIAEIANILNLSEVTIHVHLANARKSFNVKTTHAAIRKCINAGLIEYIKD